MMLWTIIFALLVSKEVVLGLILIDTIVMPLILVSAWNTILIDCCAHTWVLLTGLVLSVGHDYLHGFEVLSTRTDTLH